MRKDSRLETLDFRLSASDPACGLRSKVYSLGSVPCLLAAITTWDSVLALAIIVTVALAFAIFGRNK